MLINDYNVDNDNNNEIMIIIIIAKNCYHTVVVPLPIVVIICKTLHKCVNAQLSAAFALITFEIFTREK